MIVRMNYSKGDWFEILIQIHSLDYDDWLTFEHSFKKILSMEYSTLTNNKQQENKIVQHQMIQTRFEVRDSNSNPSYDEFWTLFSSWLIDFDSRFFPEVKRQLQVGNSYILERAATTTIESSRTTPWRKRLNNDAGESNPYGSSATGWPNTLC